MSKLRFLLLALVVTMLGFNSCKNDDDTGSTTAIQASDIDGQVVRDWNKLFLEIDRYAPGFRPPAASRLLAYVGLASYESAVPGMPEYRSLKTNYSGLVIPTAPTSEIHWGLAVNASYAFMFRQFYSQVNQTYLDKITALENRYIDEYSSGLSSDIVTNSQNWGKSVATAVYNWSETDVAGDKANLNPRPSTYVPPTTGPNGEKLWQPTPPDYTRALFPYWGDVRPFAMTQSDLIAKPPLTWSENPESKFYNQAKETKVWVDNASYEDVWIAEFWSDDIFELTFEPAARLISIANQLSTEDQFTLDKNVHLYASLGMSLCDAGIAIWKSKYIYNVERPITFIRRNIDPNWKPILNNVRAGVYGMTPEFPAYPSGHSGFGSAGAEILGEFFGNNRTFTDNSHTGRTDFHSDPRTYTNMKYVGIEDAYSRLPLGVHYRMDCDEGIRLGYLSAQRVLNLPWKK